MYQKVLIEHVFDYILKAFAFSSVFQSVLT